MPLYWAALFLILYLVIGNSIPISILGWLDLMWYVVFVIIVIDLWFVSCYYLPSKLVVTLGYPIVHITMTMCHSGYL